MKESNKNKETLPEYSFTLKEKPHKVSTIQFHYGSPDAQEKDRIFKMSFSVEVEQVPKSLQNFHVTIPLSSCFDVLKTNNNAPMAAYMEKILDDLGDMEMKEIEMMKVLNSEGFHFSEFIEGVIFSMRFNFENVALEEGDVW